MQSFLIKLSRIILFALIYTIIAYFIPIGQGELTPNYLIGALVTGSLYGILFNYVESKLIVSRIKRILVVSAPIFIIQFFNPLLEGYFFTTSIGTTEAVGGTIFGLIISIVYSTVASSLFSLRAISHDPNLDLKKVYNSWKLSDWSLLILAALSWPIIYFIFGSLVSPIVTPYYRDPYSPYYLTLPDLGTVLMLQTIRGLIYFASLIPLISSLRLNPRSMFMVLTGFMYIGGGLAIFVTVETFPLTLRIVHGSEILADSLVYSATLSYVIYSRRVLRA